MSDGRRDGDEPLEEPSPELRELYRRLEPPPLADGADEADAETRRVVGWMQAAWRELEIPAARAPIAVRQRPRVARFALLAAAALLVLGAVLWRALAGRTPASAPISVQAPDPAAASTVEVLAALPDRIELRSGPVRLVLLEPPHTLPVRDRESDVSSPGG